MRNLKGKAVFSLHSDFSYVEATYQNLTLSKTTLYNKSQFKKRRERDGDRERHKERGKEKGGLKNKGREKGIREREKESMFIWDCGREAG